MKVKLPIKHPKFRYLFLSFFILVSLQSYAEILCGNIDGFEFTNGHESVNLKDGGIYAFDELPGHFYVNAHINGNSQSVKYKVQNLDTGEIYPSTIENSLPYTYPAGNADWNLGKGRFKVTAILYKLDFGFGKCDTKTVIFTIGDVTCLADAGTLAADSDAVTLIDGTATISATPQGDAYVPDGYTQAYVLTMGDGLVIKALGGEPSFEVTEAGMYTIHSIVFNADTLDTGIVVPGQTTGFDVNGLLIQGGGTICASLDVAGAKVEVESCKAMAGTLAADSDAVTLIDGTATISATPQGDAYVPDGYTQAYVLTMGDGLVIKALGGEPSFEVTEAGMYTIHSIVFNADTLDTGIVVPGQTTGFDVNGLLIQGGGTICASLDVAGAKVEVESCKAMAGTLAADSDAVTLIDGTATISATPQGDAYVPDGYTQAYVLTMGDGLVIKALGGEPSFEVTEEGMYTIHSIVFNADTLDTGIVVPGETTGFDVNGLLIQGGGTICASLDVAGAKVEVESCKAMAGTLAADSDAVTLIDGTATISATPQGDAYVPDGYTQAYVLTMGDGLVIKALGGEPSFEVTEEGMYTIHSIVFNADTLDTGIVVPGETTGFDVNGLLIQGGGTICASLDVAGAKVDVESCKAMAGTLASDSDAVTLIDGTATISATPQGDAYVPDGYTQAYVLTMGDGLVIKALGGEPSFEVTEEGMYTIHSIVFNADTLDTGIVVPGETTGFDVNGLLIQGGGTICASLDVAGAKVDVESCKAMAGTLASDSDAVTLIDGTATISATPQGDAYVPDGYTQAYVLTMGDGLVIKALGGEPSFEVTEEGMYTIHSIVFNADTLDTGIVVPGQTTGFDVNGLLIQGGGTICASLDVAGAKVEVEEEGVCNADSGTLYSKRPINCLTNGSAYITAKAKDAAVIPDGYEQLYVLTEAFSLTILDVSPTPEFEVDHRGFFRIHSLVYNPSTLDLSVVVPGQTTGFDVVNLITDNGICASLDVDGAVNLVIGSRWFCYFFNKFFKKGRTGKTNNSGKGSGNLNLNEIVNSYDSYQAFKDDFIAENGRVKFFPNPVVNTLRVDMEIFDDEVMNYSVIDISGRRVISGSAKDLEYGAQTVDTSRLKAGMYLVQFTSEYRTITEKIIVKK
ncbi:T9SS type A sorting domain-containing protein [Algibacter aquimarinus]|uniref:PKD/Chitinase domain-containing protein n=1 Tax=Algibacter aquimarinus TaxID=1136748 RepID=A0ABP9H7J7_9FLAO